MSFLHGLINMKMILYIYQHLQDALQSLSLHSDSHTNNTIQIFFKKKKALIRYMPDSKFCS